MSKRNCLQKEAIGELCVDRTDAVTAKPKKQLRHPYGRLLVATNPFVALDALGRPCGVCPIDPEDPRFYNPRTKTLLSPSPTSPLHLRAVGAQMFVGEVTRALSDKREEKYNFRTERRANHWGFVREPFEVPDTKFYRRQIAEGALLDATKDVETGRACARSLSKCATEPRWI